MASSGQAFELDRIALDPGAFELPRQNGDAVGRTGELAQAAGHAARLSVLELNQHRHPPEGVGEVDRLLRELHDEGLLGPADVAEEIAEEVARGDR
jgi:hypothetical protein